MARSQEKAHTMMNKWVTAKQRMRLGLFVLLDLLPLVLLALVLFIFYQT